MRCPSLKELPPAPPGKTGWPWTLESPPLSDRTPDGLPWPLISIVTPSFNQAGFLEETIRSVLLQGYPRLEYFVIDGGSSDGSAEIIKKYEPWLSAWVSEKDRGQSHAINKGFARCTGDLMTFQNSDDYYLPNALQSAARLWRKNQHAGAIVGGFQRCDTVSKPLGDVVPAILRVPSPADLTLGPPGVYRLHQVSTLFSGKVLDEVGRYVKEELHYVMDRELLYRVCRKSRLILSPDCYAAFRWHENSKSIASVLPFAREFAQLYLSQLNGDPRDDALRSRMARYRMATGCLKAAKASPRFFPAAIHLVKAARMDFSLLRTRGYLKAWYRALLPGPATS